jgi:hypothetical protein
MHNKNKYDLSIFLVSKESGRRLINFLLEAGCSISPGLKNEKIYIDGYGSTACSLLICTTKSINETYDNLQAIIVQEKIYCFGFVLADFRQGSSKINGGFMPEKDESITNGPYR